MEEKIDSTNSWFLYRIQLSKRSESACGVHCDDTIVSGQCSTEAEATIGYLSAVL